MEGTGEERNAASHPVSSSLLGLLFPPCKRPVAEVSLRQRVASGQQRCELHASAYVSELALSLFCSLCLEVCFLFAGLVVHKQRYGDHSHAKGENDDDEGGGGGDPFMWSLDNDSNLC